MKLTKVSKSGKVIVLFILIFFNSVLNAQDTSIIKYLPLQVGNTWVYNWTTVVPPTTGKVKLKITNTVIQNGHTYYVFQQNGNTCACGVNTVSPFINTLGPLRVDSTTGNILTPGAGCPGLTNENLIDSLNKKIGDPFITPCNIMNCYDTSMVNVLGTSRRTKFFSDNVMTHYTSRKYAKYLGLYNSMKGCQFGYSCTYNIQGCVINGIVYGDTSFPVGINQISTEIPESFSLSQNYPNPFNPTTKIRFALPALPLRQAGLPPSPQGEGLGVRVTIYDILGREIKTLVNEQLQPGTYEVDFDGTDYASGVYYYTLTAGNYIETRKMVLLR
ncbi:MAG TPA: T9SS type A sorting domain-containing protein [Ignavibacteria bacterium]|nr:T9SS type A sorting domain-containing protein [Ignavibacteria bacterium]